MRVLFLDIDGVLNSYDNCMTYSRMFPDDEDWDLGTCKLWDPHAITALKFILDSITDLKVVIHSTWRHTTDLPTFKDYFKKVGLDPERIYGYTKTNAKAQSIKDYLKDNEVKSYVILDDRDMEDSTHQVFVNSITGLTFENVVKAFEILEEDPKLPVILF